MEITAIGTNRIEQYRRDIRAWAQDVTAFIEIHADAAKEK